MFTPPTGRSSRVQNGNNDNATGQTENFLFCCSSNTKDKPKQQHRPHNHFDGVFGNDMMYRSLSMGQRAAEAPKPHQQLHQAWLSALFSNGCSAPSPRTPPPVSRSSQLASPPDTHRVTSVSAPFKCASPSEEDGKPMVSPYPVQARYHAPSSLRISPIKSVAIRPYEVVGHPSFRICRLRLPPHLLHLLDTIVTGCEEYARTLPTGWLTDLYSLTKQDIALREVPHLYHAAKPITAYIKRSIAYLYGANSIKLDRNQPHVLKYSTDSGHTGVELHHDKCDFTANLVLSRGTSYIGGGTFFPDAGEVCRLEFGEFLLHPGGLVHGGVKITGGTRYLMVIFANAK